MPATPFTPVEAAIGGLLIGLAAVLMMAMTGRIAGVSGFLSRLLPPFSDNLWLTRAAFIIGLVAAPALASAAGFVDVSIDITSNLFLLIAAGLLVGFGSVYGNGCTSGHGVCGSARLSPRSLAATGTFMVTAIVTVFVIRHVLGG